MAEETNNKAKLYAALATFRGKIEQPKKDATNPYYKQGYVSLAGVQDTVDKAIPGTGLSYMQFVSDSQDGNKSVETVITHESGEAISSGRLTLVPTKRDPQGYGSAITYAKRYQLAAMFGVSSELDDDANVASQPNYNQQRTNNNQRKSSGPTYGNRQQNGNYRQQQKPTQQGSQQRANAQPPKKPIQTKEQRLENALNILASMQKTTPQQVKAALTEAYKDTDKYKEDPVQALLDGATAMFKEIGEETKKKQG